jgi:hypothetical protein
MNERIKELEILCRIAEYNEFGDVVEVGFDYKKFAELIVKECAELATKEYNNYGSLHGNDLLKHFGVEE